MIRVTVKLEASKAMQEIIDHLNQLTPAQAAAFKAEFAKELDRRSRDDKSARWLNDAIAAYERRTGHKL